MEQYGWNWVTERYELIKVWNKPERKKHEKPNNQKNLPSDKRRDGWKLKIEKIRQFRNEHL